MPKLVKYHSKENASNVSVDNVSVVIFNFPALKSYYAHKLTETSIMMFN